MAVPRSSSLVAAGGGPRALQVQHTNINSNDGSSTAAAADGVVAAAGEALSVSALPGCSFASGAPMSIHASNSSTQAVEARGKSCLPPAADGSNQLLSLSYLHKLIFLYWKISSDKVLSARLSRWNPCCCPPGKNKLSDPGGASAPAVAAPLPATSCESPPLCSYDSSTGAAEWDVADVSVPIAATGADALSTQKNEAAKTELSNICKNNNNSTHANCCYCVKATAGAAAGASDCSSSQCCRALGGAQVGGCSQQQQQQQQCTSQFQLDCNRAGAATRVCCCYCSLTDPEVTAAADAEFSALRSHILELPSGEQQENEPQQQQFDQPLQLEQQLADQQRQQLQQQRQQELNSGAKRAEPVAVNEAGELQELRQSTQREAAAAARRMIVPPARTARIGEGAAKTASTTEEKRNGFFAKQSVQQQKGCETREQQKRRLRCALLFRDGVKHSSCRKLHSFSPSRRCLHCSLCCSPTSKRAFSTSAARDRAAFFRMRESEPPLIRQKCTNLHQQRQQAGQQQQQQQENQQPAVPPAGMIAADSNTYTRSGSSVSFRSEDYEELTPSIDIQQQEQPLSRRCSSILSSSSSSTGSRETSSSRVNSGEVKRSSELKNSSIGSSNSMELHTESNGSSVVNCRSNNCNTVLSSTRCSSNAISSSSGFQGHGELGCRISAIAASSFTRAVAFAPATLRSDCTDNMVCSYELVGNQRRGDRNSDEVAALSVSQNVQIEKSTVNTKGFGVAVLRKMPASQHGGVEGGSSEVRRCSNKTDAPLSHSGPHACGDASETGEKMQAITVNSCHIQGTAAGKSVVPFFPLSTTTQSPAFPAAACGACVGCRSQIDTHYSCDTSLNSSRRCERIAKPPTSSKIGIEYLSNNKKQSSGDFGRLDRTSKRCDNSGSNSSSSSSEKVPLYYYTSLFLPDEESVSTDDVSSTASNACVSSPLLAAAAAFPHHVAADANVPAVSPGPLLGSGSARHVLESAAVSAPARLSVPAAVCPTKRLERTSSTVSTTEPFFADTTSSSSVASSCGVSAACPPSVFVGQVHCADDVFLAAGSDAGFSGASAGANSDGICAPSSVVTVAEPKLRIYVDGVFDLPHSGHFNALRQARGLGCHLVVGVNSGSSVAAAKKVYPLYSAAERAEILRACKWVDEVVVDTPYKVSVRLLQRLQCAFAAHGHDAAPTADGTDAYQEVRDAGKLLTFQRTDGISSSTIIRRLLRASGCFGPPTSPPFPLSFLHHHYNNATTIPPKPSSPRRTIKETSHIFTAGSASSGDFPQQQKKPVFLSANIHHKDKHEEAPLSLYSSQSAFGEGTCRFSRRFVDGKGGSRFAACVDCFFGGENGACDERRKRRSSDNHNNGDNFVNSDIYSDDNGSCCCLRSCGLDSGGLEKCVTGDSGGGHCCSSAAVGGGCGGNNSLSGGDGAVVEAADGKKTGGAVNNKCGGRAAGGGGCVRGEEVVVSGAEVVRGKDAQITTGDVAAANGGSDGDCVFFAEAAVKSREFRPSDDDGGGGGGPAIVVDCVKKTEGCCVCRCGVSKHQQHAGDFRGGSTGPLEDLCRTRSRCASCEQERGGGSRRRRKKRSDVDNSSCECSCENSGSCTDSFEKKTGQETPSSVCCGEATSEGKQSGEGDSLLVHVQRSSSLQQLSKKHGGAESAAAVVAASAGAAEERRMLMSTERLLQFIGQPKKPQKGDKIVYLDGSFDVFHVGHVRILEKAKQLGDYLIVGIHDDHTVTRVKGPGFPVMNVHERALNVLAMRVVDEVIIGAPWEIPLYMLKQFDIQLVVRGKRTDDVSACCSPLSSSPAEATPTSTTSTSAPAHVVAVDSSYVDQSDAPSFSGVVGSVVNSCATSPLISHKKQQQHLDVVGLVQQRQRQATTRDPYRVPKKLGIYREIESFSFLTTRELVKRVLARKEALLKTIDKRCSKEAGLWLEETEEELFKKQP